MLSWLPKLKIKFTIELENWFNIIEIYGCKHNNKSQRCQGLNPFQGLILTCDIQVMVYNLNFSFFIPNLTLCARYDFFFYKLILYHIYYASMFFTTQKSITFVQDTSSKFMIFKAKNRFQLKALKYVVNMNFTNFSSFFSFNHQ
jgi:hypothetical protein